jgi:hypothetical protein
MIPKGGLGGAPPGDADGVVGGSIGFRIARSDGVHFPDRCSPSFLPPTRPVSSLPVWGNPLADGLQQHFGDDLRLGPILCNRHQAEIPGKALGNPHIQRGGSLPLFRPACRRGSRGLRLC